MFKDNPDFYPTPPQLIRKMTSKIEWKHIKSVLEPSAGKGDLVEAIHNQFKYTKNYRGNSKYDIDSIEQDENLRHILEGKSYRVIADDFLTFNTYKKYDLIFMNPPFSSGVKHLLKAIELIEKQQRSGQIVCLLNAETLKNPYSNDRKFLIRKLEEINAEVEYIQNAFSNSERNTEVETAIIYISIEKQEYSSVLIEELKKDESHRINEDYKATQLVDFIKGIVEQFNYEIKAGLKLINEYNSLKPLMLHSFNDDSTPILKLLIDKNTEENDIENAYIKQIRAKYWNTLFNNDQFMGLFTSNLKQKYLEHVEELKDYDFSFVQYLYIENSDEQRDDAGRGRYNT
ncbi:DNA N-6-adenine-methyltransferase [Bacillus velezensis]|uniref:DNA N-6-adenine-methyltransferase n=1 Tax=Bacillus velezensis TaxID=492670 RepID=UPI003EBA94AE